jgi:uncharacterized protein YecT (DUF1311 family)
MKKMTIGELQELKNRNTLSGYFAATDRVRRLKGIIAIVEANPASLTIEEMTRYIPIGLVAAMEGFTRSIIGELIDSGSPFLERISGFRDLKFDAEIITALQQKKVSIGELVSHLLPPINSLGHIQKYMDILLDDDFVQCLKPMTKREANNEEHPEPILKEPEKVFASIVETFRLRHIYAHETAFNFKTEVSMLKEACEHVSSFIEATEELIVKILKLPITTQEQREYAAEKCANAKLEMDTLVEKIRTGLYIGGDSELLQQFDDSQRSWGDFANLQSRFEADLDAKGGTLWPVINMSTETESTNKRMDSLKYISKRLNVDSGT